MDVRRGVSGYAAARRFSMALAKEIGCPLVDREADDQKTAPIDTTPPAGVGFKLFALATLLTCWIPVIGLVLVVVAIFYTYRYALPNWLSLMLVPALLVSIVTSVLGIVGVLLEHGLLL